MTDSTIPEEEAQWLVTQTDVAAAKRAWAKGDKSEPTTASRAFAAQAAGTAADTRILDPNTAHSDPVKSLKVRPKHSTSHACCHTVCDQCVDHGSCCFIMSF